MVMEEEASSSPLWLRVFQINDVYELENFPHFYTLIHEYNDATENDYNDNDNNTNNNENNSHDHNKNNKNHNCSNDKATTAKTSKATKKIIAKPDKTLVVLSGDFLAPSLLSSLDKGAAMVDVMNRCGFTHVCFGNHECDIPMEALYKRIASSEFTWVNSNMQDLNTVLKDIAEIQQQNLQQQNQQLMVGEKKELPTKYIHRRGSMSNAIAFNTPIHTPECDIIQISKHTPLSETNNNNNGHNNNSPSIRTKRIGILGLLTNEDGLYRPGSFGNAQIENVIPTTKKLLSKYNDDVDFWLPMTHQSMQDDRKFASIFGSTFPIIIGGHDHTIFDEQIIIQGDDNNNTCEEKTLVNGCNHHHNNNGISRIIKTGMDAKHTAIIDFRWYDDDDDDDKNNNHNQPKISVNMIPTKSYPPNPQIQACVDGHLQIVRELERAKLFPIVQWNPAVATTAATSTNSNNDMLDLIHGRTTEEKENDNYNYNDTNNNHSSVVFSTMNNRLEPGMGTTILTTMIRMGMQATCALMNAGSIRGNTTYDVDSFFTWSDLKAEIPFPTNMVSLYIPGRVIEATIRYSRQASRQVPPVASGGFLHTCTNITYNDTTETIDIIDGEPMQPEQLYMTASPVQFFGGIDNLVPLLDWAKENDITIHPESATPAKLILVEFLSAILWLQLGTTFHDLDSNGDGILTRDDIHISVSKHFQETSVADLIVDNVMSIADIHNTGIITPMDMIIVHLVATDLLSPRPTVMTEEELTSVMCQTAARVMEKDVTDMSVLAMVNRIRENLYLDCQQQTGTVIRIKKTLGQLRRRSLLV